jgi:hypothetical protein
MLQHRYWREGRPPPPMISGVSGGSPTRSTISLFHLVKIYLGGTNSERLAGVISRSERAVPSQSYLISEFVNRPDLPQVKVILAALDPFSISKWVPFRLTKTPMRCLGSVPTTRCTSRLFNRYAPVWASVGCFTLGTARWQPWSGFWSYSTFHQPSTPGFALILRNRHEK